MTKSPQWHGIAHPLLCVRNMRDALFFYVTVLGFELVEAADNNPAGNKYAARWLNIVKGDSTQQVHLITYDSAKRFKRCVWNIWQYLTSLLAGWAYEKAGKILAHHIAFYVDDITEFRARLAQYGVPTLKLPQAITKGHQVYFLDPSGNILEAIQAKQGFETKDVFS